MFDKNGTYLFGLPTTIQGVPYIQILKVWLPPAYSYPGGLCVTWDSVAIVSPSELPPPEDPRGRCGMVPPVNAYRMG